MENSKKSKVIGIITSILLVLLGIASLVLPGLVGDTITTILGVFLIALGVILFVIAFTTVTGLVINLFSSVLTVGGVISIILGILLCTNPVGVIKIIGVIFAIFAILSGIFKLSFIFQCVSMHTKFWINELIFGALYVILGVVILCNLDSLSTVLVYCFGSYLIVLGISKFIDNVTKDAPKYEFKISHDKINKEETKSSKKEFSNEDEIVDADFSEKK